MNKTALFSIGEMSKLHDVPVKTLRYYDEIGVLTPVYVNPENGYRYYSLAQFEILSTIKYLRFLGIPLSEIIEHAVNRDVYDFVRLLKRQQQLTEKKIEALNVIRNRFKSRINEIETAVGITEHGIITLEHHRSRKIVRERTLIRTNDDLEFALRQIVLKHQLVSSIFIGKVCLSVSEENLKRGITDEYSSVFILGEDFLEEVAFDESLPEGNYLRITFIGDHTQSGPSYQKLFDHMRANRYEITGDAIERTIMDHSVSNKKEHYITEIQIPVIH
ncbi:MAG TPA: MerR family transcriptional regulator [Thermotogota bacterium]|nr:MerR family transcriptional regulator [Thermotogota bacterium]HPR97485.1 MerR family transcriptional regulator [Thermotogota bacterium]